MTRLLGLSGRVIGVFLLFTIESFHVHPLSMNLISHSLTLNVFHPLGLSHLHSKYEVHELTLLIGSFCI
jgi:hypothetical protein